MAKGIDWIKIRTEYETGNIAQRKLADKYNVSYPTLRDRAKREEWSRSKEKTRSKIIERTLQKAVNREVSRNDRILSIADRLADKIEKAVEELESYLVTNRTKTKTITYDNSTKKPSKEVIKENEIKEIVSGIIDKQGLKFLTAALRDIKELQPKDNNNDNGIKESNDRIVTLADLLNNPVKDRPISDFEEEE